MTIEITGIEGIQERLTLLSSSLREEIVAKAVFAAAKVIADAEREDAPILATPNPGSDELEPGELRDSIRVHRRRLDKDGFAVAKIGPTGNRARHAAHLVEYGHKLVKGNSLKGIAHEIGSVEAYPFLRPAYERSVDEAIEAFKGTMREGIGKVLA